MIVKQFDTNHGYYEFQFDGLETEVHSHPVIEILMDSEGKMTLSNPHTTKENLFLIIIDANVPHEIFAPESRLQVVMVEHQELLVKQFLSQQGIKLKDGYFVSDISGQCTIDIDALSERLRSQEPGNHYDERVSKVLTHLQRHDVKYDEMLDELTDLVHLSRSRLSHLFSQQMGVSIKKYLLWCKLRNAVAQHLNEDEDLFASLIDSGFYDQPHFSRAFKAMLGVNPTKAYNSRTVQFYGN